MLYELIGIVRPGNLAEVKEIVSTTGALILRERGVIRGLSNWGVFSLPRAVSAHQMRHSTGHYFAMRYDASVDTQKSVSKVLRNDPRMIRHTSVKLGDGKLDTMSRIGAIGWQRLGMGDEKRV
ncbi:mitochondrial 37S ribosomal protein YmS16 [Apiospora marii]|uniref:Mitochondrial 37S ribosomal protein YmS16 n=1 Tax=Apiospora marii TaxID=335849 RepID=A0ABR1R2B2_9PEZI